MARIIIIEDEAIIADDIEMMLEMMGHEVIGNVQNGDKALDIFSTNNPDLVILDITIKGSLNGIDLAHIIRDKYNFPFVYLTSHSDRMTLDAVKETLPYGYIVKPFTRQNLMSTIELAIHKFVSENQNGILDRKDLNSKLETHLTDREYTVLKSLTEGLTYKEIASKHSLSINTVKSYLKATFLKLNVASRHEATTKLLAMKN